MYWPSLTLIHAVARPILALGFSYTGIPIGKGANRRSRGSHDTVLSHTWPQLKFRRIRGTFGTLASCLLFALMRVVIHAQRRKHLIPYAEWRRVSR
jgi:hypothetical protein